MSIFSRRRRSAPAPMPAPPPPAPVAQPAMPNAYLRNLPQPTQVAQPVGLDQQRVQQSQPMGLQQRMMQQAQPNLSDAIALGKAGDQAGMQRMMQQIVGLPPSGAPQQPGMQQRQFPQPGQMGQMTDFQRLAMEMQQRQAQIASQMQPQPGMQQTVGPGLTPQGNLFNPMVNPQSNDALKQQFLAQQGIYQPLPAYQNPAQQARVMEQMAQQAAMQPQQMGPQQPGLLGGAYPGQLVAQQPGMPQRMTMDMPQAQQPMPEFPTQPGLTPMPFPQPGMQPQQPNSLGQQFGQAQNPFARPMQQQAFGQSSMPQGIGQSQQQSFGQAQQPSNIMSSKFGSAFGGGTQPQQQPQQPGMQQNNPMQKAGGSTGRTGLF